MKNSVPALGLEQEFLTKQLPSICFVYNEDFYVFSSCFSVIYLVLMIQKNFCTYLKTKALVLVTNAGLV